MHILDQTWIISKDIIREKRIIRKDIYTQRVNGDILKYNNSPFWEERKKNTNKFSQIQQGLHNLKIGIILASVTIQTQNMGKHKYSNTTQESLYAF